MFELVNPIPRGTQDEKELEELFQKYHIIPYYGNYESTSHYYLNLLYDVTALSGSHAACKKDIKNYSFGEMLDVIPKREEIDCDRVEDERDILQKPVKLAFKEKLKSIGINLRKVPRTTKALFDDFEDVGNAYLLIRIVKVGGTYKVFTFPLKSRNVAYLSNQSEPTVINTEYFSEEWWKKKPPSVYTASDWCDDFNWRVKNDVWETVVHIKNIADESPFYGRPSILPVINWMFTEYSMSDLACKVSATEYVSKHILAFEETDPVRYRNRKGNKANLKDRAHKLRTLTSAEGHNPKSMAVMEYAHGTKPPTSIKLDVNRDTDHNRYLLESASSAIFSQWSWHKELVGFEKMRSNTGRSLIRELFIVRNVSTVRPKQRFWENIWGEIFEQVLKITDPGMTSNTIKFPDLLKELIDALGEDKDDELDNIAVAQ